MAIKDKDGKVYRLVGPNPLMTEQAEWDATKLEIANLKWKDQTVSDEQNPIEKFKSDYNIIDISEELGLKPNEEVAHNVVELVAPPKPVEPPKQVVFDADQKTREFLRKNRVEFHCVPASDDQVQDPLYGRTYQVTRYGSKFIFDAVIVDQGDLHLQFWAVREIPVRSVVYPQNRDKKWWRVQRYESKTGGFLYEAIVSDVNPDFS